MDGQSNGPLQRCPIILVDSRVGSKHLAPLLGPLATLVQLEYGDACFSGSGGITVGVECKTVLDALGCMHSGRLADRQLPGMMASFDIRYLVIEGLYRAEPGSGILQYYKGELGKWGRWQDATTGSKRKMYDAFEKWLHSMAELSGTRLEKTPNTEGTASLLLSLFRWWNSDEHKSFRVLDETIDTEAALLSRPTRTRRIAALLPRIGWKRSKEIVRRFPTVRQMVDANLEDWLWEGHIAIDTAKEIMAALHER